jgi:hypothetical protein
VALAQFSFTLWDGKRRSEPQQQSTLWKPINGD